MGRVERLQDHPAAAFASTGTARHLGQHLEHPLPGKRIRQIETDIGQHHPDQGHKWQVKAFGEHLCADQHVRLVVGEVGQDHLVSILLAGGFPVPAQGARFWKKGGHFRLDPFAAQSILTDVSAPALRACLRLLALVATLVAEQPFLLIDVQSQRCIAVRTAQDQATITAEDISGGPTPVQEQDRLFAAPEG